MGDAICKINSAAVSFLRVFLLNRSYAVSPLRRSTYVAIITSLF